MEDVVRRKTILGEVVQNKGVEKILAELPTHRHVFRFKVVHDKV
jgi:hypothetical protein